MDKRLKRIEAAVAASSDVGAVVVIYDVRGGRQAGAIPPGARVVVWMPDNGRDSAPGGN